MISYYLPSGSKIGVGYQAHALAEEYVRQGHSVSLFSNCPPIKGATYDHNTIALQGSIRTFRFALALRRADFSSFDALHAHGDDYWLWRRRVPRHVRTLHGSCFEEALTIQGLKEKFRMVLLGVSEVLASLVADDTVVVSPDTRRWTPWVHRVIPNGVDTTRFVPGVAPKNRVPTVLFVGTWGGRKRGAELAEAFARDVRPSMPEARLIMVTRDAPDVLPDGIRVMGEVSDAALARLYSQAWLFCLPSDYEGFGIPYVEAMASGTPIVATPNPGALYVTDQGRCGVLTSRAEMGTTILELLRDAERRARLSALGLERAQEFTLRGVAETYLELLSTKPTLQER